MNYAVVTNDMPATVVLTGSTGSVGTYLLNTLESYREVDKIHCLNRSLDAETRQISSFENCGLTTEIPNSKIHFHHYDLEQDNLGLNPNSSDVISKTATHYIHCAWPVDWNRAFSSFLPAIRGVSKLLQFVQRSPQTPRFLFISSIAAAGNWASLPGARLKVPEEEIEDWKAARFGYGQAKLVAERLVADAARTGSFTGTICRLGQICGPILQGEKGSWPLQEWFPSLIISSKQLGMIPSTLGPLEDLDWVPVDIVSDITIELLFAEQRQGSTIYNHIVNPRSVSWSTLLPAIQRQLGKDIRTVSLADWVKAMKATGDTGLDIAKIPAFKLLSFFSDLSEKSIHLPKARVATLDVRCTLKRSKTLSTLGPIENEWIDLWIKQWEIGTSIA